MDFNDPNAGAQLNWQAAYQQYASDEQSEGRQPLPIQEFVQHMSAEAQRRQQRGLPIIPQQPGAGLGPGPQAQPQAAQLQGLGLDRGGGLMDTTRGLFDERN